MQFAKTLFTTSRETSPFRAPPRPSSALDNPWYFAGYASAFPNIDPTSPSFSFGTTTLSSTVPVPVPLGAGTNSSTKPATPLPICKILQLSSSSSLTKSPPSPPTLLSPTDIDTHTLSSQILIFKYRDTIHAIDHQCPHSSYPLSRGRVGDIEDFGVVLSAEITCPKHGWAFDLYTGRSDRGSYQLRIWEVDVRKGWRSGSGGESRVEGVDGGELGGEEGEEGSDEVWVRKKVKKRQG